MSTMKTMNTLLSLLLICIMVSPVSGQLTSREIDKLVEDTMEKFTVAGVAVGVVKDGKILHAKGYGLKSVDTGEKVNEHTSFAIASNSKAFTTAALAILVEEGLLSWQDRVIDHIPEFKMYNDYVTQNFNVQDLLTHRSGLGLGAGDLQKWPAGSDFTIKDMLVNFQHFEPVSAFRTKYDYDNILYLVAGELIKRVSGMPWEVFVKKRIMEPLNMDHSFTLPPGMVNSENLASPHLAEAGKLRTISYYELDPEKINGAAGGVLSNVDDLCRWMLVHLNQGKYGENLEHQLFSEASQLEMWKIHTPIPMKPNERYNPHFSGYGLGWRLSDMNGNMSVSHTGDLSGMLSKTMMIPDLELGVVVLTNSYYGGAGVFQAVSQTIVDSYLGLDDYGWTDRKLASFQSESNKAKVRVEQVWSAVAASNDDHINPSDFTGTYEDKWFGKISIYLQDDQLWFSSLRSPALTGPMFFYKANAFAIKWKNRELDADAFAIFSLDEEGKARRISMKGISPDIDFSYDFQDLDFLRVD
ncbi:MAG: serine hydrolase [Bacteroidales bacterium]|nr:serine hydrolase [Bacteroidales bacterium]